MEENETQQKSILGNWWLPIRKWFYPVWLIYELSIRFFEYGDSVYHYFKEFQNSFGALGVQALPVFCGIATFLICSFYLTVPACFTLYKFFKNDKPIGNRLSYKIKAYF